MANKKKQMKIKRNLNQIWKEITSGNPKYREKYQSDAIKYIKNLIIQDKKLLIYLMIMLKLDLTLPIKQNRDQNVKY